MESLNLIIYLQIPICNPIFQKHFFEHLKKFEEIKRGSETFFIKF